VIPIPRKYFFFDIDGTIAENDRAPSIMTKYALRQLRLQGHRIFVCTGRTLCDVYPAITSIGFHGIISGAGANITLKEMTLFQRAIPPILLRETVSRMLAHNISGVLEGTDQMYIVKGGVPLGWEIPMPAICRIEQLETAQDIEKFTLHVASAAQLNPIKAFLERYYDLYPNEDGTFCECVYKGRDKGSAIARVLEHYHAQPKDAVAFGDSLNDCAMFQNVGTAVAMGNAPQALADIASMVTGSIREEGVYHALVQLRFIEELPPKKNDEV
jgi:Cof subfamily protein (haloacid dehalogenase superfamily)